MWNLLQVFIDKDRAFNDHIPTCMTMAKSGSWYLLVEEWSLYCDDRLLFLIHLNSKHSNPDNIFNCGAAEGNLCKIRSTGNLGDGQQPTVCFLRPCKFRPGIWFQSHDQQPSRPQSNREADNAVRTVKQLLRKSPDPQTALLAYRATPLAGREEDKINSSNHLTSVETSLTKP